MALPEIIQYKISWKHILNWPAIRRTEWAKIVGPQTHDHNSVKSIVKFFSLEDSFVNSSVLAKRARYMTHLVYIFLLKANNFTGNICKQLVIQLAINM